MEHNHAVLSDLKVHERAKILETFGVTVTDHIPAHPQRLTATVERDDGELRIALTKLSCGCLAIIHPSHARSLEQAEVERFLGLGEDEAMTSAQRLQGRLDAAAKGETVSGEEVVALREQVELDAITARAVADLEDAEAEQAAAKERAAIEQPILDTLTTHREQLDALQQTAYQAIVELMESAAAHTAMVTNAVEELTVIAADSDDPRSVTSQGKGRTRIVRIGASAHEYWPAQDWVAGVLAAAHQQRQLIGASRWSRAELPRLFPGTPRPRTE